MLPVGVQTELETYFKKKIVTIAPLSVVNDVFLYRVVPEGNVSYAVKIAPHDLEVEAWMLTYLKEKSDLPVPEVYYSKKNLLIMEHIETNYTLDKVCRKNAAEMLAALHQIKSDTYGLERDTLFGGLPQPNPQTDDWLSFFRDQRLLFMAGECLKEEHIDKKMMKQIEKLSSKLNKYIVNPNPPSLIHGDVWSGNILPHNGRVAAFLDPAIYYADPEIELAFILMLKTFERPFFMRYNEISPIKEGFFEERADIYKLYPLLLYVRLFGSSYVRKVQKILDKFL